MSYTNEWLSGASSAIAGLGKALRFPEMGISEYVGGQPAPQPQPLLSPVVEGAQAPDMSSEWQLPAGTRQGNNVWNGSSWVYSPSGQTTTNNVPGEQQPSGPSVDDILNRQYEDYIGSINQMEGTLGTQKTNQEAQIGSLFSSGAGQLGSQLTSGNEQIGVNQGKSLRDIGSSIAAGFRAGNNLLGSMGAGDSSAANQYAYALAKEGSKQRGNAMGLYNNQRFQLQQSYNQGLAQLASQRDQAIYNVANWFSQQQMSLQGMRADAARNRSEQNLAIALQRLQTIDQSSATMRTNLANWAMSVSSNLGQLATNMQGVSQYQAPGYTTPSISSQVGSTAPRYFSQSANEKTSSLFQPVNYNYLNT